MQTRYTESVPLSAPSRKKRKYAHGVKPQRKVVKLEKPLSELTESVEHIPLVDIEAYVNRSAEERRKEVEEGKTGRVKRPMNPFMLYRKAYQNRCKCWCVDNSNQAISQVSGSSWSLEPDWVKDQFQEWSRIETINHHNAFPEYKYRPRVHSLEKTISEDSDSEESDVDDNWEEEPAMKRPKRQSRLISKRAENTRDARIGSSSRYSLSRKSFTEPRYMPYKKPHRQFPSGYLQAPNLVGEPSHIFEQKLYQPPNPENPVPAPYDQSSQPIRPYFQQIISRTMPYPDIIEDVVLRRIAVHGMGHFNLPGGHAPWLPQEVVMATEHNFNPTPNAYPMPHIQASLPTLNAYPNPYPPALLFTPGQSMTPEPIIDPAVTALDRAQHDNAQVNQESVYPLGPLEDIPESEWQEPYGHANHQMYAATGESQVHERMQTGHDLNLTPEETIDPDFLSADLWATA